ncbi:hypothetical protein ACM66B_001556 [Microbotryomycetes sp. NB124-2]
MAETAPARVPFSHGAAVNNNSNNGSTGHKHRKRDSTTSARSFATARPTPSASASRPPPPLVPPSPSEFPSLGNSSSASSSPAPIPAAVAVDNSQPSWASVSKAVLPEAPKGSIVSKLQPSSTGPSSPYSRPPAPSTAAAASTTNGSADDAHSKLPRHNGSRRAGSLPRSHTTSSSLAGAGAGQVGNNGNNKKKGSAATSGHRKSQSQSRLPTYAAHHQNQHHHQANTVPATLLKPLSPKSSSLSPLAPSFSFKPRSSTSPDNSSAESSPARRHHQETPHFIEDLSPNAPTFEPEQAPFGLGLNETGESEQQQLEDQQQEQEALIVDERPPSPTLKEAESEQDQQVAPNSEHVQEEIGLQETKHIETEVAENEAVGAKGVEEEQEQTTPADEDAKTSLPEPLVHGLETKVEQEQESEQADEQEPAKETTLPEPLVHAIENKVEAVEQQDEPETTTSTVATGEPTNFLEPLVHALENKVETKEEDETAANGDETRTTSDSARQDEQDLPITVEQVPSKLAEQEQQLAEEAESQVAANDIPVSAEEVVAEESLAEILDVDEVPGEELKKEMDRLELEQTADEVVVSLAPTESESVIGSAPEASAGETVQDGGASDAHEPSKPCLAPTWEPFEDPESSPAAISQTRLEEGQNAMTSSKRDEDEDEDESSTPRPAAVEAASSSEQPSQNPTPAGDAAAAAGDTAPQGENRSEQSSAEQSPSTTDLVTSADAPPPPSNTGCDNGRDPNSDEAPSLTMAIVNAWHSTTWAKRIPAIIASVAINFGLPFVNGVMLGFGELFARNWIGIRMGWGNPFRAPGLSSQPPASGARANTSNVGLRGSSDHPLSGSAGVRTAVEAAEQEAVGLAHHA